MTTLKNLAVWQFMEKFGMPMRLRVDDPAFHENAQARIEQLIEETVELSRACRNKDRAAMLDALVDLEFFLIGTYFTFGFEGAREEAFKRVAEANMAKVRGEGARQYQWDVVKPEGWKPPCLDDLVE